jgi:hypothetical protein
MHCVVCNKQARFIGPIFVEATRTNQQYLQKLQNEVILVIQGAGHVTFFQHNGVQPHTANVILDVLHDVFGSHVLSNQSRLLQVLVVLATMFIRHEFL